MAMALTFSEMEIPIKASTTKASLRDSDSTNGKTGAFTSATSRTGSNKGRESGEKTIYQLATSMRASTSWTRSMAMGSSPGRAAICIRATMLRTSEKATARCTGLTELFTRASGNKDANMDREKCFCLMELYSMVTLK